MFYLSIIAKKFVFESIQRFIKKNSYHEIHVWHEHGNMGKHVHCLITEELKKDEIQKIAKALHNFLRFERKKLGLLPFNKEQFITKIFNVEELENWMRYTKWEKAMNKSNIQLNGNGITETWQSMWNNIKDETALEAKKDSNKRKRDFVVEEERKRKRIDIEWITEKLIKYNIWQISDINNMSREDNITRLTIPNAEYLAQSILDLLEDERVHFERKSMDKEEQWDWKDISLYNMFRLRNYTEKEEHFIYSKDVDYYKPGIMLLKLIFYMNNIDVKKFFNDVDNIIDCKLDKINTLCLVGNSDSGKSTLSKVLSSNLKKACIGQSGNASQFIFQDIVNKRLIQHEECVVIPNIKDDMKNLFEGSVNWSINVKNKKNQMVQHRTPLITTSNADPWQEWCTSSANVFRNRCIVYNIDTPMDKELIHKICERYPNHIANDGRIYLNFLHYYMFVKAAEADVIEDPDALFEFIEQEALKFHRICHYDFNGTAYQIMDYPTFIEIQNTPSTVELSGESDNEEEAELEQEEPHEQNDEELENPFIEDVEEDEELNNEYQHENRKITQEEIQKKKAQFQIL